MVSFIKKAVEISYGKDYEYSYNISSSRCSKAWMSAEGQDAPYRLGTCLASFVQNGRQYSLCAQIEFNVKGQNGTRTPVNQLQYYLYITTPSGYTYAQWYHLGSVDIENADQIKTAMESAEGVTLKVQRNKTTFSIYINDKLLDSRNVAGDHFFYNNFFSFNADTVASFGVSAYGGEADFTNFQVAIQR